MKNIDITGNRYGRLVVVSRCLRKRGRTSSGKLHEKRWFCKCDCGKTKKIQQNNLRSGHTTSCGCLTVENSVKASTTHGACGTKAWAVWSTMRLRCLNPKHDKYKYYGGRGIGVCDRWIKFSNFLEDMGQPPDGMQIDRIDNDKGYSKENCRWVDRKTNARNKSNTVRVCFDGKVTALRDVADITKLPYHALYRRVMEWGMDIDYAILSAQNMRRRKRAT